LGYFQSPQKNKKRSKKREEVRSISGGDVSYSRGARPPQKGGGIRGEISLPQVTEESDMAFINHPAEKSEDWAKKIKAWITKRELKHSPR